MMPFRKELTVAGALLLLCPALQAQTLSSQRDQASSDAMARGALPAQQLVELAADASRPTWLREKAIYNLGARSLGEPGIIGSLRTFARDADPRIAAQAIYALKRKVFPDTETVEVMLAGLRNRAPEVRIAAAEALRAFKMYRDDDPAKALPVDKVREALREAFAAEKYYYAHDKWVAGPPIVSALKDYGVTEQEIDALWEAAPLGPSPPSPRN